jgi:hypothetical protein
MRFTYILWCIMILVNIRVIVTYGIFMTFVLRHALSVVEVSRYFTDMDIWHGVIFFALHK